MSFPAGRVLGLDYGHKRVGIAVSDATRVVAQPLEVVTRSSAAARVRELCQEYEISLIVVGLPTSLSGTEGPAAEAARRFGAEIALATRLPVAFVDERFTSSTAEKAMIEAGVKRRKRRQGVDKVAASVILQGFLDRPQ